MIKNKRISFIIGFIYDKKCRVWVAKVANLPGCMSQGATKAEALENVKDAIDGCLAARKKDMNNFKNAMIISTLMKGGELSSRNL